MEISTILLMAISVILLPLILLWIQSNISEPVGVQRCEFIYERILNPLVELGEVGKLIEEYEKLCGNLSEREKKAIWKSFQDLSGDPLWSIPRDKEEIFRRALEDYVGALKKASKAGGIERVKRMLLETNSSVAAELENGDSPWIRAAKRAFDDGKYNLFWILYRSAEKDLTIWGMQNDFGAGYGVAIFWGEPKPDIYGISSVAISGWMYPSVGVFNLRGMGGDVYTAAGARTVVEFHLEVFPQDEPGKIIDHVSYVSLRVFKGFMIVFPCCPFGRNFIPISPLLFTLSARFGPLDFLIFEERRGCYIVDQEIYYSPAITLSADLMINLVVLDLYLDASFGMGFPVSFSDFKAPVIFPPRYGIGLDVNFSIPIFSISSLEITGEGPKTDLGMAE